MNENLTNKFYISFMSSLSLGNSDQCYLKPTELLSQCFIFINTRKKILIKNKISIFSLEKTAFDIFKNIKIII